MNKIEKIDVLIGIKAEQSLRDVIRQMLEETDENNAGLELTPVGRKDWIAGVRFDSSVLCKDIEFICRDIHKKLLKLNSQQRIRLESIRLYVVSKPVPIFKDHSDKLDLQESTSQFNEQIAPNAVVQQEGHDSESESGKPLICSVCKRTVHSFNIHYSSKGKIVGCFMCGGNSGKF